MSPLRAPTVGGLAGGVGVTTVARALHAREVGPVAGAVRLPDVVVCRATVSGLALADRPQPDDRERAPVLAVTDVRDDPDSRLADHVARVADGWAGAVVLPRVASWDTVEDPFDEAAGLLGRSGHPDPLARYAEGLARIVALLTAGGRLERSDDGWDVLGALRPIRGVRVGPPSPARAPGSGFARAGTAW